MASTFFQKSLSNSEITEVLPQPNQIPPKKNKKMKMKKKKGNGWKKTSSRHSAWLQDQKHTLMVVATLIAGMAYQTGLAPPGGVWENRHNATTAHYFEQGTSVLATTHGLVYRVLYTTNTIALISSLTVILMLISGLPFVVRGVFMWILTVTMWAAITSIALTYAISVNSFTPPLDGLDQVPGTVGFIFGWCILMALVLISHTVILIIAYRHDHQLKKKKEEEDEKMQFEQVAQV